MHGGDGESFTSDGCCGAYFGGVIAVDGKSLTLQSDSTCGKKEWHSGGMVAITSGRGLGQWRSLEKCGVRTLELSSAFEIAPDRTSTVTVVPLQEHYVFYKNRFFDSGVAFQFYGSGVEHIVAENESRNAGGFYTEALKYGDGVQPQIGIQFLHNSVSGLNFRRDGVGSGNLGPSLIQARASGPSSVIGLVIRNNNLMDNSGIRIQIWSRAGMKGILIEGNHLSKSGRISVDSSVGTEVVLR
jgi:hypothetical protein